MSKINQSFKPAALKIFAAGQNPVKDDWNKLKPTKKVNHNQLGSDKLTLANNKDPMINKPAIADTALLIVIVKSFLFESRHCNIN